MKYLSATVGLRIREECLLEDFWAAAEVHAAAFCQKGAPLSFNLAKIARFNDIVRSSRLRFRRESLLGWQGRYVCLVAQCCEQQSAAAAGDMSLMTTVLRSVYPQEFGVGIVNDPCASGICGAMNVDSTGRFIPPLAVTLNGEKIRKRPEGCAYFSNVSVLPQLRRCGVGTRLIQEAERLVQEWGCWGAAMHCSQENAAAYELYTKQGYSCVEGIPRDKNECVFLAKVFSS